MSLSEKISELDRRISSTVSASVQGVLAELRTSLKQSQSAVEERLASLERSLPATFLEEDDLNRVASDAAGAARSSALLELREAIASLDRSPSQAEILRTLLHESRRFAPRAAVFITQTDLARGWEDIGFPYNDPSGQDQAIASLAVAYSVSTGWSRFAEGRGSVSLGAGDCAVVASHLGVPNASEGVLIPIVLADCVAAALYADRANDGDRFEAAALQMLAFAASQAIEGLSFRSRTSTPTLRSVEESAGVGLPLWSADAAGAGSGATEAPAPEPPQAETPAAEPPSWGAPAFATVSEPVPSWPETELATPAPVEPLVAEPAIPEPAVPAPIPAVPALTEAELQIEREIELAVEEVGPPSLEPVAPRETLTWASDVALPADDEIELDVETYQLSEEPPSPRLPPVDSIEPVEIPVEIDEPGEPWGQPAAELFEPEPLEAAEPLSSETYELPRVELESAEPPWPVEGTPAPVPAPVPAPAPIGFATTMMSSLDVNEDATILIPRRALVPPPEPVAPPPSPPAPASEEEDETVSGRQGLGGLRQLGVPRAGTSAEVAAPRGFEGPGLAFVQSRATGGDSALHEAAHRLARLLVNEIKLYNEEQVIEGRRQRDIYHRLRDEIERSRKMFEQQTSPEVRATRDFFTDELVRQLADGDRDALGA